LTDSFVVLKKNYRFGKDSGIGAVATAVNKGENNKALEMLAGNAHTDIVWRDVPSQDILKKFLIENAMAGYKEYLETETPSEALNSFDSFRILCALRHGAFGVVGINIFVESLLAEKGLIDPHNRWYHGRPVMITANDYNLKLFNGDVGIVFNDRASQGNAKVYFPSPDGGIRHISPVRLPAHETVYAMTVHKSQGSEFDKALLILPPADSELLTRELVYTAVSRARSGVEIWGDEKIFTAAVQRRIERRSGLKEALWGAESDGGFTDDMGKNLSGPLPQGE
jgi:exodeoxyribonuclease V alpha subunit